MTKSIVRSVSAYSSARRSASSSGVDNATSDLKAINSVADYTDEYFGFSLSIGVINREVAGVAIRRRVKPSYVGTRIPGHRCLE